MKALKKRLPEGWLFIMELPTDHLVILEIIGSAPRTIHTLGVLDQKKRMSQLVGGPFDKKEVLSILEALKEKGLIEFLPDIESWKVTKKGHDYLD